MLNNPLNTGYVSPNVLNTGLLGQSNVSLVQACACRGPQNGEPLCPCAMRNVQSVNGRYVLPGRDLGPATEGRNV